MKKLILILLIILVQGFVFGQEKNDTTKSKLKYAINFSIHNLGNAITWQTGLSFDLIYKRHTWSTGITGGPGLHLYMHGQGSLGPGHYDYFEFQQDYQRWGVYGIDLAYQFQFNKINRETKSSILFCMSYSRYRNTHRLKTDVDYEVIIKNMAQCLVGYSFKDIITKKLSLGINILGGIRYYYDREDCPNANPSPSSSLHNKYYKLLPNIRLEPNITYTF